MKRILACLLSLSFWAPAALPADSLTLRGYAAESSRAQRDWEARFRAIPDPARMRAYMQRMTAKPHYVGSPFDKENADWILSQLKQWGLDAHIETFEVLFPTPKERVLEMVEPARFKAKLVEPAVPGDATSTQQDEQLPTYNAYSIDGDVTAPLVYVNYGVPEDYEALERQGISVKGAIVIARYGHSWRGIKPKVAAEHGAVGCLIYSDPGDDGYTAGDVFPAGPFRPKDGVQRGSVLDMPVIPGDPLTPGVGATRDARRLSLKEVTTLTRIPVLPISYADAQPLLAALHGPVAPSDWRGNLPITYHIGPGAAKVHLKVAFNWETKPIYDVIGRIPGSAYPDEWIIRGNHHDAWVYGADDPVSAMASVLDEARAFGMLLRQGWKPKRTIVICAWDGEEPGLLGSTEWAEAHASELRRSGVAYVNSDSNGRGYLGISGSHTLEKFINGVARDIEDPEAKVSVWQRMQFARLAGPSALPAPERQEARSRPDLRIGALGSGSDYTAFVDHLGIPSLHLGFGGEDEGGIYHSIYDDFYWYTHFSDKDFVYGRALAQTAGTAVMRLADADLLPFDFDDFTDTIKRYVGQVQKLARDRRESILERNGLIEEGAFSALEDPRARTVPPKADPVPPILNFAPLENASAALEHATRNYDRALAHAAENGGAALARASLEGVNGKLTMFERALTLESGLPGRPWFRHQVYAPGLYTGYGVKTLPAVRESIEQKQWGIAEEQIVRVGKVLENAAEAIQAAAVELNRAGQ